MKKITQLFSLLMLVATIGHAQQLPTFSPDDIDIPHQKFVLDNGLTLLVHEDHKAPIVAVNVWYHVGSKNEKPGKSGFAHLFEHLMFNGSENFDDDYFQAIERIGGTDVNGTTNNDRTNYFQNVPLAALDQVLFLESDRMGHLLGAVDTALLNEQRGVVQNEKRQGENQPYGRQFDLITKAMFPKGHPYSWTVIGEMEDLNAASLDDVHQWFKDYYGTANAVICIAGDVNTLDILKKVKRYFGHIPAGPTIVRPEVNIPERTNNTRQTYQDRVPEVRIVQVWNTPQLGAKEDAHFDLISSILSSGKNSRLYKKLIYEDQTASSANAFQWSKEIASNFIIQSNVKPDQDAAKIEQTLNEVLAKFLAEGPTEEELSRAKASYFSSYIKGLERIGGFGGKSDVLASNQTYFGDSKFYKTFNTYISETTIADLKATANKWLSKGKHTLICEPYPKYTTDEPQIDRSKGLPPLNEPQAANFPDLQEMTLSNGMKVILAQRKGVPTVVMNMVFDAGYASDQFSSPGTAGLAMSMIDEGTKNKTSLEINETLQYLGASIGAYSDLDASYISMNTLKPSLDASLDLYSDIILNPAFPQAEFDRLKNERLAQIQREKASPVQMALRVMPQYLYGEGHAYNMPLTGSGHESTVKEMSKGDMVKFYEDWIRPNNATLVIVGDVEMKDLKAKLESRFKSWKKKSVPKKNLATVKPAKGKTLYLMNRPESQQSIILGGYITEPYGGVNEIAREAMNNVLGGEFTSRINMNLREDKHWAYGAFNIIFQAKGQRPLLAYAPVQTDKTSESVAELMKEFEQFVGDKPVTQAEFEKTQTNTVLQLPGQWETNSAVSNSLVNMVKYGLSKDYYKQYDQAVRNTTLADVKKTSKAMIHPEQMNWFIVGDKEKILPKLKEMGFDQIIEVDADGKPITGKKVLKP